MNTKKLMGGLVFAIIAVMAFIGAPEANAFVNESINGTFYKVGMENEHITISYSKSYGRATVTYQVWECDEPVVHYSLSGPVKNGTLVVSGKGVSNGKRRSMKVKITQVSYDKIKVTTSNGRSYYFTRGEDW